MGNGEYTESNQMAGLNKNISIITWSVIDLNITIKR